jgi:predicted XRE-type DNA-binding protein
MDMGDLLRFPDADNPFRERLEKAGAHERDTREAHQLALRARNELVHKAVDNKYLQAAVARDLKISRPSVTRILAMPPYTASDAA